MSILYLNFPRLLFNQAFFFFFSSSYLRNPKKLGFFHVFFSRLWLDFLNGINRLDVFVIIYFQPFKAILHSYLLSFSIIVLCAYQFQVSTGFYTLPNLSCDAHTSLAHLLSSKQECNHVHPLSWTAHILSALKVLYVKYRMSNTCLNDKACLGV